VTCQVPETHLNNLLLLDVKELRKKFIVLFPSFPAVYNEVFTILYLHSVLVEQHSTGNTARSFTCEFSNPFPRAESLDNFWCPSKMKLIS